MIGALGSLSRVAQSRLRDARRRVQLRAALAGGAVLFGLIAFGFAIMAATVALAMEIGAVSALLVMTAAAAVIAVALVLIFKAQARRDRRTAAMRAELDSRLLKAAALSMVPGISAPSRPVLGLGLVALGALLVLVRRGSKDDNDGT